MTMRMALFGALTLGAAIVVSFGQVSPGPATGRSDAEVQTDYGKFLIPSEFVDQRTGTVDSYAGAIRRKSDGFTIRFDIGIMAGTRMVDGMRSSCTYFRAHSINGVMALTGMQSKDGAKTITTTIYDPKSKNAPANFWATITSDADLADFFIIVSTFKPTVK